MYMDEEMLPRTATKVTAAVKRISFVFTLLKPCAHLGVSVRDFKSVNTCGRKWSIFSGRICQDVLLWPPRSLVAGGAPDDR